MKPFLRRSVFAATLLTGVGLSIAAPRFLPSRPAAILDQSTLQAVATASRPRYDLRADVDWEVLSFRAQGDISVPVAPGDVLNDAVFFLFANAGGVGGDDAKRKNIAVDAVSLNGQKVPWTLDGAVLRVRLPQPQRETFALHIDWHGVVPRAPQSGGGLMDLMGGLGGDIGGIGGLMGGLGGAATPATKPKNTDYGLYSYGNGVLSLGSFWYPSLAVRRQNRWIDEAPEGLGDVAYAEASDFAVSVETPATVRVVAPGRELPVGKAKGITGERFHWKFEAANVRDFAVLMSDEFVRQAKTLDIGGRKVLLESFTTRAHQNKSVQALDVAGAALQIYSRRFGPYPYHRFAVVEGPLRAGAGGMEYSGMTAIASALYGDLQKELGALAGSLGAAVPGAGGDLGNLLGDLEKEAYGDAAPANPNAPQVANPEGDNPATEMLSGLLGQQGAIFESMFEATLAHEVAHQWWAIGVGSDSQRAPWVDESLTNYSSMIYFEDRYGKAKAAQMIDLHLKTAYSTGRMLGNTDAPVNLKTAAYSGNIQYGAIVYGKGALFYDALRGLVGDAAFFGALRKYFAAYENRLADSGALQRLIEAEAPQKRAAIQALYRRWIRESHGDQDITGGAPASITDLLGGLMGGGLNAEE